jgi:hypothetical protein
MQCGEANICSCICERRLDLDAGRAAVTLLDIKGRGSEGMAAARTCA